MLFGKKVEVNLGDNLRIIHIHEGKVVSEKTIHNIICNVGLAKVAGLVAGTATGGFGYVAVGTGTTAAAATDTALGIEVMRVASTNSLITTSVTNDTSQMVATFNFTASYAITESGVFDASSGGNLLAHQVFSAINVVSGDAIIITWQIQFS